MDDLMQMASEPLCVELEACLDLDGAIPMVRHPLVHTIAHGAHGVLNRMLHDKQRLLVKASLREDWHTFVFTHERPYRLEAMLDTPAPYGQLAAQVWTDCENIPESLPLWADLFATTNGRDWMSPEDKAAFNRLPDELTVYRGECDDGGWSWTLDHDTAVYFANRGLNGSTGRVLKGWVDKRDVFAYLGGRGESEILVTDSTKVMWKKEL